MEQDNGWSSALQKSVAIHELNWRFVISKCVIHCVFVSPRIYWREISRKLCLLRMTSTSWDWSSAATSRFRLDSRVKLCCGSGNFRIQIQRGFWSENEMQQIFAYFLENGLLNSCVVIVNQNIKNLPPKIFTLNFWTGFDLSQHSEPDTVRLGGSG